MWGLCNIVPAGVGVAGLAPHIWFLGWCEFVVAVGALWLFDYVLCGWLMWDLAVGFAAVGFLG